MDKYNIIEVLGAGAYGDITLVEAKYDFTAGETQISKGDKFAMKTFTLVQSDGFLGHDTICEVDILNRIKFPYVLGAIDTFQINNNGTCSGINIILPLAIGDLDKYIQQQQAIVGETELVGKLSMFHELLMGLLQLHSNYIIHNDLKPQNILLFDRFGRTEPSEEEWEVSISKTDGEEYYRNKKNPDIAIWEKPISVNGFDLNIKIADFGISTIVSGIISVSTTTVSQTYPWRPPELFKMSEVQHSFESDIWAMGILFYELATGEDPYGYPLPAESNIPDMITKWKTKKWKNHPRLSTPNGKLLADLISKMLEFDTNKRITAEKALEHPFFTSNSMLFDENILTSLNMVTMNDSVIQYITEHERSIQLTRLYQFVLAKYDNDEIIFAIIILAIDIFDRTFGRCSDNVRNVAFVALIIAFKIYKEDYGELLENQSKPRLQSLRSLECKMMECMNWSPFRPTLQMVFDDVDVDLLLKCYIDNIVVDNIGHCAYSGSNLKEYILRSGGVKIIDISDKALAPLHVRHGDRFVTKRIYGSFIGFKDKILYVLLDKDEHVSNYINISDYSAMIKRGIIPLHK